MGKVIAIVTRKGVDLSRLPSRATKLLNPLLFLRDPSDRPAANLKFSRLTGQLAVQLIQLFCQISKVLWVTGSRQSLRPSV